LILLTLLADCPGLQGNFVIEYAGEVIDERELSRRMDHARMNGEQHFYIMELQPGAQRPACSRGLVCLTA
jgi:hypothetical protein